MSNTAFHNSLETVHTIMQHLAHAQMATWLFGGWAEELHALCPPRPHQDIDLLYPAQDFTHLDQWLTTTRDFSIISAKRFSHKRALLYKQIMIELFLLEPQQESYITRFFDNTFQLIWPTNTLDLLFVANRSIPLASVQALSLYRQKHQHITDAYHR